MKRVAIVVLVGGCAAGEWQHVVVRPVRPHAPPVTPVGRRHHRLPGPCTARGRMAPELEDTIRDVARAALSDDGSSVYVDARDEISAVTVIKRGGWRTFYCIGVATQGDTTTLVVRYDGGVIR